MRIGDVRSFDRFARLYDLLVPGADTGPLEAGLQRAQRDVEFVLDVGGGPGRALRALGCDGVVVDPAAGMVERARKRGLGAVRGDGARLPVADDAVDAVVVSDALHHVADQRGVLREAARVLRPGGVLVVREFDPTTLRGRALVAAESAFGFDSTFTSPAALCADVGSVGLEPAVVEDGFGYTVAGVLPTEGENTNASARL